jgi:3,4-dihydroxy 2-butanone 4-phosphate synthase/GTP cyclohydrolase II
MISPTEDIIAEAKAGRMVILVDDEERENEGDLFVPADCVTPEIINFMAREGRGLICLPLDGVICDRLGLEPMTRHNTAKNKTAFTVSIEAIEGITTGISAFDRAHTIKCAIDPRTKPDDLAHPGHIFPIRAVRGGVLERAGHTEAAVELAKFAGFTGAGVICEIMNDDGAMARLPDLIPYAAKHGLKIGSIADLISYRQRCGLAECATG